MFQTASYTDPGGRPCNEDCTAVQEREGKLCLVVADGLGGHGGGAQASARAAEILCAHWDGRVEPEALQALFQEAHAQVLSLQTPDCPMKTTAAALLLEDGRAAWPTWATRACTTSTTGGSLSRRGTTACRRWPFCWGTSRRSRSAFTPTATACCARSPGGRRAGRGARRAALPRAARLPAVLDGFWEYVLEEEMGQDLAAAADPADWIARMRARLRARVPADNDNNTAAAVWLRQK